MDSKLLVNRVKTTGEVKAIMDGYYEELRRAHQDGKLLAWTYGPVPFEMLRAVDIRYEQLETYGAYLATRAGQERLKQLSEAEGYSVDICSYARLTRGVAILAETGDATSVPRELLVPLPDLLVAHRQCALQGTIYDYQRRLFNKPGFIFDVMPTHSEAEFEENACYVRRQLDDFVVFLEDITRRRFDYDRLKQIMACVKEAAVRRKHVIQLCRTIPAPMTVFDHFISLGPAFTQRGSRESVEYFRRLEAEVEERVANRIGSVSDEKYRLYWDNLPIWFKIGRLSEMLASHCAVLVAAQYTHEQFYAHEPEEINANDPLTAIAREMSWLRWGFSDLSHRIDMIHKEIEEYSIDGLIMCSHRTCQPMDIGQYDIMEAIKRRTGVPGVLIDADPTDASFYSDAQTETKLQAFMESLAKREKR